MVLFCSTGFFSSVAYKKNTQLVGGGGRRQQSAYARCAPERKNLKEMMTAHASTYSSIVSR